jgi:PAS domain S-box-containing protein
MPDTSMPIAPAPGALFAAIVNSSSDAITSQDLNGIITSWNKGAERMFGYSGAEVIGQPVSVLSAPERPEEGLKLLARIRGGELIDPHETVRKRKDGAVIDISLTVSPILDEAGKIVGISEIARDITEQKRNQERLRVTLSSIGDAVISTDARGVVLFMNPAAERLTGWEQRDAYGKPLDSVFEIVAESDRRPVVSPVAVVLRDGQVVELANHTLLVARDRTEKPVDDSAAPIRDDRGNLIGVVLVFRDVSTRRETELAAVRLAAIVEGSDDAIVSKNLQGIVTTWNPAAQRIFGYTAEEMIGQPIMRLMPPDRVSEEQQILARLQQGQRVDHFQTVRRRKDGQLIDVSLTISPIRDKDGVIVGASKIARDVTELRKAQQRLEAHAAELESKVRERTAKLQETVSELEAFSYSLSHDMRAPLRAITSYTEIVMEDCGAKIPEGLDYLKKVVNSANRLDRLIRDVLNFARISREQIEVVPTDVNRLLDDIVRERPELQSTRVTLRVEPSLLPVLAHEALLTQCLTNLIENAIKFVAKGTRPNVRIYTEDVGARVRVCVADNGIGIDPEGQKRLFGIFQRLNPGPTYKGTGVGLAIVRRAVERMAGAVGVQSTPGLGSVFWIELPQP